MIRFPWPNPRFFPNKKINHRWLKAERDTAKEIGFWLVRDAGLIVPANGDLELSITICPPTRRVYDDDAVYSSFKHYRDGMFLALGTDDRRVRRTVLEWGEVEKNGALYVDLKEKGS